MPSRRIPSIPPPMASNPMPAIHAMASVLTHITAQSQPAIEPLAAGATSAEIIAKLNAVISRLQGTP